MSFNLVYISKKLFHKVFNDEEYNEFLGVINGKDKTISSVDISPIINFGHSLIEGYNEYILIYLYQHIKYYLEYKNEFSPKLQEGIALCMSKAIIIDEFIPAKIGNYVNFGDRRTYKGNNPFEEICRMLLMAINEPKYLNSNAEHIMEKASNSPKRESKEFLNLVSLFLNRNRLEQSVRSCYHHEVINEIESDLELSNIDSSCPIGATRKENREILVSQFNRIYDIYSSKIELGILFGQIPDRLSRDRLLTVFNNKIIYATRNIGIYEKTKRLDK